MEKPLYIKLHIISPVHIGCDDVYEPTGFVIDEKSRKLIEFDPIEFIKSLSPNDRKLFITLCEEGTISSIVGIYKFIANRTVSKNREIDIVSELVPHYKKVITFKTNDERRIKQELNQFTISRTAYNSYSSNSYIPGSSLKGALKTAFLSKQASDLNIKNCWNKYLRRNELANNRRIYDLIGKKKVAKKLERDLLNGDFETDPFRMVKVSDFMPVGDAKRKIVYAINKKKKISKSNARGLPLILETIQPGALFAGAINIQQPKPGANVKKPVVEMEFLESINKFYMSIAEEENKVANRIGVSHTVLKKINDVFKDRLGKSAFLVRIGRHSGAEAVTIEGNRNIKIMQEKGQAPKYLDHATTIWLASEASKPKSNNGLVPFGWAVMEVFDKPIELKINTPEIDEKELPKASIEIVAKEEDKKLIDKIIFNIKLLNPTDAGRIGTLIDDALAKLTTEEDKRKFAQVVKEHLGKAFKKSKARKKLESFLE